MPQVPRGASASTALRITEARPVVSRAKSDPRPVNAMISAVASALDESIVCVAPSSSATASRLASISTPMIVVAPTTFAAMMAESPTDPVPKTANEAPAGMASALITAPAPVWIPQAKGPSSSSGTSVGTLTTLRSWQRACVANDDWPKKLLWMLSAPLLRAVDPSERSARKLWAKKSSQ